MNKLFENYQIDRNILKNITKGYKTKRNVKK